MNIQNALKTYERICRKNGSKTYLQIDADDGVIYRHPTIANEPLISAEDIQADDWIEATPLMTSYGTLIDMLDDGVNLLTSESIGNQVVIVVDGNLHLVSLPYLETRLFSPTTSQLKEDWWHPQLTKDALNKLKNVISFYVFEDAGEKAQ